MPVTISDAEIAFLTEGMGEIRRGILKLKEENARLKKYRREARVNITRLNRAHRLCLLEYQALRRRFDALNTHTAPPLAVNMPAYHGAQQESLADPNKWFVRHE